MKLLKKKYINEKGVGVNDNKYILVGEFRKKPKLKGCDFEENFA